MKINYGQWFVGQNYILCDRSVNLYKIGLSKNAPKRRYFLSLEYQSDLQIVAIVRSPSMLLCEKLMHKIYRKVRKYRRKDGRLLDGGSEWFAIARPRLAALMMFAIVYSLWAIVILCGIFAAIAIYVALFGNASAYKVMLGLILVGVGLNAHRILRRKLK